ncbi:hypothetical protein GWI33_017416 [Rhynchophorus ferrugineus]|uniref:Uncharacterized protein n=1 Tax=Rhynchophorus ferrugineus TaxID=354439 RepID=A0A834MIG1_RHYFE|nr:hypothetical protein GWI33_017416 [Rhynchophorus ferrugineus]
MGRVRLRSLKCNFHRSRIRLASIEPAWGIVLYQGMGPGDPLPATVRRSVAILVLLQPSRPKSQKTTARRKKRIGLLVGDRAGGPPPKRQGWSFESRSHSSTTTRGNEFF